MAVSNNIFKFLGIQLDDKNRFIKIDLNTQTISTKSVDPTKLDNTIEKQKILFQTLIQKLQKPSNDALDEHNLDKSAKKGHLLFTIATKNILALNPSQVAQFSARKELAAELELHVKKFSKIAQVRRQSFMLSRQSAVQGSKHMRGGSKTAEDGATKTFSSSAPKERPKSVLIKSLSGESIDKTQDPFDPKKHRKQRSKSFNAFKEGAEKTTTQKQAEIYFQRSFESFKAPSANLHRSKPIMVPSPNESKELVSPRKISDKKGVSRTVAKLQKELQDNERDYSNALTNFDNSILHEFQNHWKNIHIGKIDTLIESFSDKKITRILEHLKKLPLMGLLCQTLISRYLKNIPKDFEELSQDLVGHFFYIQIEGMEKNSNTFTDQSNPENAFKIYTTLFLNLLVTILNNLPISGDLGQKIIAIWKRIILRVEPNEKNHETFIQSLREFLRKLGQDELFEERNLVKLSLQESFFLNSLGRILAFLFMPTSTNIYLITASEVVYYFQKNGFQCDFQKGGRSIIYNFNPKEEVTVVSTCLVDIIKPNFQSFTLAIKNTLTCPLPNLPNWNSKITLEMTKIPSDQKFIKEEILIPLLKLGFSIDWPS